MDRKEELILQLLSEVNRERGMSEYYREELHKLKLELEEVKGDKECQKQNS